MYEKIRLAIGQKRKMKTGFLTSFTIIYCGMPNRDVFSVCLKESSGNQGYAMNLYYPKSSRTIRVGDAEFTVFDVTPEELTVQEVLRRPEQRHAYG